MVSDFFTDVGFGGILVFGGQVVSSYNVSKVFTISKNETLNKTRFVKVGGFGVNSKSSSLTAPISPMCYSSDVEKTVEAQTKPSPSFFDEWFAVNQKRRKRKKMLKRRNSC